VLLVHLTRLGLKGASAILVLALNNGIKIPGLKKVKEKKPLKAKLDQDLLKELKLEKMIDILELKEEELIEIELLKKEEEEEEEEIVEKIREESISIMVPKHIRDLKTIKAIRLLRKPYLIYSLKDVKYLLIEDSSTKATFDNLIRCINLLAENGWRCINLVTVSLGGGPMLHWPHMYALMERIDTE